MSSEIPPMLGSGCKRNKKGRSIHTLNCTCSLDHRIHYAAVAVVDFLIDVIIVFFVVFLAIVGFVALFANVLLVLHPPVLEPRLHLRTYFQVGQLTDVLFK